MGSEISYALSPPSCLICILAIPRRQLCRRLQRVIDSDNHAQLWSSASLDMAWVAPSNRAIMEKLVTVSLSCPLTPRVPRRAAQRGNVEALIKLAVAYLYSEGGQCNEVKQTQIFHFSSSLTFLISFFFINTLLPLLSFI